MFIALEIKVEIKKLFFDSLKITIIPQKLNLELPYDPAIPLLGIYAKELKARIQTDTYTLKFIAELFTITKR